MILPADNVIDSHKHRDWARKDCQPFDRKMSGACQEAPGQAGYPEGRNTTTVLKV
jgi:hypothetical protein